MPSSTPAPRRAPQRKGGRSTSSASRLQNSAQGRAKSTARKSDVRGRDEQPDQRRRVAKSSDTTNDPKSRRRVQHENASSPPRAYKSKSTRSETIRGRPSRRTVREPTPEERERRREIEYTQSQRWGGVARKGALNIRATGQSLGEKRDASSDQTIDEWVEESPAQTRRTAPSAKQRVRYSLPTDIAAEVRKAFVGTAYQREKMVSFLARAAEAYDRNRFEEALRLGRTVADAVPGVAPVRELTGLAAYRVERWPVAKTNLRTYFDLTGDPQHLPLVMDCERAGRRYRAVPKTFALLEESEPSPEVLAEGRIVLAATLADQHEYAQAIDVLVKAGALKNLRNPSYRHVRLWYALGDLYDRAGDQGAAREMFARVVRADPDAYDAARRLGDIGAVAVAKNRKKRTVPVSKKNVTTTTKK